MTANGSTDMCGESCEARYQATPPNSIASVTRSTTESKNAPRWLDEFDALASAPSNRSGSAARITSTSPSRSSPNPIATAAPPATTRPMIVRWSGESPVLRSTLPIGLTARSIGARNLPSNIGAQPTWSKARWSVCASTPGRGRCHDVGMSSSSPATWRSPSIRSPAASRGGRRRSDRVRQPASLRS